MNLFKKELAAALAITSCFFATVFATPPKQEPLKEWKRTPHITNLYTKLYEEGPRFKNSVNILKKFTTQIFPFGRVGEKDDPFAKNILKNYGPKLLEYHKQGKAISVEHILGSTHLDNEYGYDSIRITVTERYSSEVIYALVIQCRDPLSATSPAFILWEFANGKNIVDYVMCLTTGGRYPCMFIGMDPFKIKGHFCFYENGKPAFPLTGLYSGSVSYKTFINNILGENDFNKNIAGTILFSKN